MRALLAIPPTLRAQPLRAALTGAGFVIATIVDLDDLASYARHESFNVIILAAPAGHGPTGGAIVAALRALRAAGTTTPVLVLGGGAQDQARPDTIALLRAGADDVAQSPCPAEELAERCLALVRRAHGFATPQLAVGALTLDPGTHEVRLAGRSIRLTAREFAVLRLLVLRRGGVVRKQTMLNHLYAEDADEPDAKIIDVFVCKLRRKLAEAGGPNVIDTVWGIGYRLNTPAEAPRHPVPSHLKQESGHRGTEKQCKGEATHAS